MHVEGTKQSNAIEYIWSALYDWLLAIAIVFIGKLPATRGVAIYNVGQWGHGQLQHWVRSTMHLVHPN